MNQDSVTPVEDVPFPREQEEERQDSPTSDPRIPLIPLDSLKVGIFVLDADFSVVWVNQAAERYFDLRREEILGKDKRELIRGRMRSILSEPEVVADRMLTAYENDTYVDGFECHVLPGGQREERWLEYSSRPVRSGLYAGGRIEHYYDITDRKRAEMQLTESEAKYRDIVELAPEGIVTLGLKGTVTSCNTAFSQLTGFSKDEIVGRHFSKLPTLRFRDVTKYIGIFKSILQGEIPECIEFAWTHKDGTSRWGEARVSLMRKDSRITGVQTIVRDITERKRAAQLLQALNQAATAMGQAMTPGDIFAAVAEELQQLDFHCAIFLMDESRTKLCPRHFTYGSKAVKAAEKLVGFEAEEFSAPVETLDVFRKVVWEKQVVLSEDVVGSARQLLPRPLQGLAGQVVKTLQAPKSINAPLIVEHEVIGLLSVQSDDLTVDDIPAITAFAHQIAAAWRKAQLLKQARQEIAERKRAEQALAEQTYALRESEERYRRLVETSPDAITVTDLHGKFIMVNRRALDMHGCTSAEELLGRDAFEFIAPADRQRAMENMRKTLEHGEIRNVQYTMLRKDGTAFSAELNVSLIVDAQGTPTAFLSLIRDITERKRAQEALERQAARLAALNRISNQVTSILDLQDLLQYAVNAVREKLDYLQAAVLLVDEEACELYVSAATDNFWQFIPHDYRQPVGRGAIGVAAETGETVLVEDAASDPHAYRVGDWFSPSSLSAPIRVGERVIGILEVEADETHAFDENDVMVIETTADQIAVAMENARLYGAAEQELEERGRAEEALQHRTAQLEALRQIGLDLTAQLDLDVLLQSIVLQAIQLVGATEGGIYLYRPDRDVVEWVVSVGPNMAPLGTMLRRGQGLCGKVWDTGEPLLVDDYRHWEGRAVVYEGCPFTATMGVPVRWGDEFLGVLNMNADAPHTFCQEDAELLGLFATQAAIAIRNARLYEETQRRALEQEALREAALVLTTTLERDEVIDRILAQLQHVVPYDTASVQLLHRHRDRDVLEIVGGRGFPNLEELLGVTFDPSCEDNPNREVVRTRASFIVKDAPAVYDGFRRAPHAAAGVRSWLGAPMLVGDQLIGLIALYKSEPGFYIQEHARLAEAFAAQAAIAVKNAQLFEKTQCQSRRLGQTLATSELLHQGLELKQALKQIAQGATTLGFRRTVINVRDPGGELVTVGATAGFEDGERERLEGATYRWSSFQALMQKQFQVSRSYLIRQGTVDVEQELQGVFIRLNIADRGPDYWRPDDFLLIPLRSAPGASVGLLSVDDPVDGLVPDLDTIQALETFANQAALAIQNARLFEAEQEQRELAQALEKAAAAVNSTLELDQVLDRILEQVERITGGDVSNIMLVEENDLARIVRYRGYRNLGIDTAEHTLCIGEYASLTHMMETREPMSIRDTTADARWLNPESGDEEPLRSYAGAPICTRDQVVGFLNVGSVTPNFFNRVHGRIIQTFANHAATAIENARLYQQLRNYAAGLERRVRERTAELQTQYARLDAILRSTADGIVVTDAQGKILQANPVAQAWLTHTLSPGEAGRLRDTVREVTLRASEQTVALLELKGLDLELSGAPISEPLEGVVPLDEGTISHRSGEPEAVVAIHDVSHLKALDRMKTRFVTNISHELRTPIATIKLYAGLLQGLSPEDRKWKRYLDTLTYEANHQARLVEDILQISRIDAGRLEMKPRLLSLRALTERAVASHRPAAQERGLKLEHRPAEPGPVTLVDPERMKQVLDNLIGNAIRYTPAGGEVTVSAGVEEREGRAWATVAVSDTGIGIPEEELPHIFERFFRGVEVRANQVTGTGLGLSIVQEIVELHGGHMTVESEKGAGSTFTVWLPLISEETNPAAAAPGRDPPNTS